MKFTKPDQLDGIQLKNELALEGILIDFVTDMADGFIYFDVETNKQETAKTIVSNHVPIDNQSIKNAARQAVLDKLGLTADEVAALLG